MNSQLLEALSKLSIAAITLGVLVWAMSLWHEEKKYTAETDRQNREQMAAVITEAMAASREDRRKLTQLSSNMMEKLRANEHAESAILLSLQEIIELIKKDRVEVKSELQGIIEQLETSTRSVTRELKR